MLQQGRWAHSPSLSIGASPNQRALVQIGFRTKRGMKPAVVRNRLKRQLRAICHSYRDRLTPGQDLVVVVHPKALPVRSKELEREFIELCKRLRLLSLPAF